MAVSHYEWLLADKAVHIRLMLARYIRFERLSDTKLQICFSVEIISEGNIGLLINVSTYVII